MSGTQNVSPVVQNAQNRANLIANSKYTRRRNANTITITADQQTYTIPLRSLNLLTSVDLDITLNVTCGSTAAKPQVGSPYSAIKRVGFVDQASVQRSSLTGRGLYDLLAMLGAGAPYNSVYTFAEGGADIPAIAKPAVPALAANATGTVSFRLHVPVSKSATDLTGAVLLQTGQNATPATIELTLESVLGGAATSLYDNTVTLNSGTIVVRQNSWQPLAAVSYPALDLSTINYMWETSQDSSNLVVSQEKEIPLQIQYPTDLVGIRYFNGSAFSQGGDMAKVEDWLGNILLNDSTPDERYTDYRLAHHYDCAPGLYWGDFRSAPLLNANLGLYLMRMTPSTVNAGAWVTQLYRQTRSISGAGGSQPSQTG